MQEFLETIVRRIQLFMNFKVQGKGGWVRTPLGPFGPESMEIELGRIEIFGRQG